MYRCTSCVKVVGKREGSISCNLCKSWVHRKCPLLGKCEFQTIEQSEESLFCLRCQKKNLPFLTQDRKIQQTIWNIKKTPNKTQEVNAKKNYIGNLNENVTDKGIYEQLIPSARKRCRLKNVWKSRKTPMVLALFLYQN